MTRPTMDFDDYLRRLPKVETHAHLMGTMRPSTYQAFADREGVALPRAPENFYPYENFYEFLKLSRLATSFVSSHEDFRRLMFEAMEDAFLSSNQRHTEMFFNPQYFMARGISYRTVVSGLVEGLHAAKAKYGVTALLIPSIGRQVDERGAHEIMDAILDFRVDEVIGIGLDGAERDGPPERFIGIYQRAAKAGLKRTAHVCEDNQTLDEAPPSNFITCCDDLGCDRFDHGYNLLADGEVIKKARDTGKFFTAVCLPSAPARQAKRWASIGRMVEEGLNVTLTTDNPAMFGTDLTHSYKVVCDALGWSYDEARDMSFAGVEASWLDDSDKRALRETFKAEIAALDVEAGLRSPLS
ncbi:MAG: adenosine deaminase [Pseudomonadota bacterium]|nr:adenosine deaminase [Pseudomonadota bacterium]